MHLRKVRDRLTRHHAAAFSEIGYQDLWQRSAIVVAVAASDLGVLEQRMSAVIGFLDSQEWELTSVCQEVVDE